MSLADYASLTQNADQQQRQPGFGYQPPPPEQPDPSDNLPQQPSLRQQPPQPQPALAPEPPTPPPPPQPPKTAQNVPATLPQTGPSQVPSPPRGDEGYQPYIASQANSPPGSWGKDDLVLAGARNYPGLAPGPYMPQPADYHRLIPEIGMGLGRYGSRYVGGSALAMASYANAYQKAFQASQMHAAQMHAQQFRQSLAETAERQKRESNEYGEAWALYGPHPEKNDPGNEDRMRQAIWDIANKYQDDRMRNVLAQEGLAQAEKLMQFRHATGLDAEKLLTQMIKQQQLDNARRAGELQKQKMEANRQKAEDAKRQWDPFLLHPNDQPQPGPGDGKYGSAPDATPGDPGLEWYKPGQEAPPAVPAPGRPPAESAPTSEDGTEAAEPEARAQPQQPTRVAEADTGTMSDAPPSYAVAAADEDQGPQREGAPRTDRLDLEQRRAPPAAPATATPGAPQPRAPGELPGITVEAPRVEWQPTPSKALADPRTPDGRQLDPRGLDMQAQRMVNGSIKIQDIRGWPKPYLSMVEARAAEIESEMNRIQTDPNLKSSDDVYRALNKVNPQFAATLRGYISGDFPVPASAWKNPQYLERVIGIGQKIDPTFNATNFKIRATTKQSYASGQDARNMTSIATLDRHATRYLADLQELKRRDPWVWQQYLAGGAMAQRLGISPEVSALVGRLNVDMETVANEYERAVTGGKPTVSGRNNELDKLQWKAGITSGNLNSTMDAVRDMQAFAHERMHVLLQRYQSVVGRGRDDLGRLYQSYAAGSPDVGTDALGNLSTPDADGVQRLLGAGQQQPGAIPPGWTVTPIQ